MAFKLYGLIGCRHCIEADQYLAKVGVPYQAYIANGDPVIEEGVKAITGVTGMASFPVLVALDAHEVVVGFNLEAYEKLVKAFHEAKSTFSPAEAPTGA